eukprot:TRINITY_DN1251_c1_g1_i2.p1 TRINITY_DN1251_c1_g1~~TRINITY_DN1251_c1_g1_i2.p1  ORF type:complete len:757 (+),score=223.72 TRINITY_DN1251_c1_g1_i2:365-2635(+)
MDWKEAISPSKFSSQKGSFNANNKKEWNERGEEKFHTLNPMFFGQSGMIQSNERERQESKDQFSPSSEDEIILFSKSNSSASSFAVSSPLMDGRRQHKRSKTVGRPIDVIESQEMEKKMDRNENENDSSSLSSHLFYSSSSSLDPIFAESLNDKQNKKNHSMEVTENFFLPHGITDEEENGGVSSSVDVNSEDEEDSSLDIPLSSLSDSEVAFQNSVWKNKIGSFLAPLSSWSFTGGHQKQENSNSTKREVSRHQSAMNNPTQIANNYGIETTMSYSSMNKSLNSHSPIVSPSSKSPSPINQRSKEGKSSPSSMSANSPSFVSSRNNLSPSSIPFPPMLNSSQLPKYTSPPFYPSGSVSDDGELSRSKISNPFPNWNVLPSLPHSNNIQQSYKTNTKTVNRTSEYVVSKPTSLRQHRTERKTWKVKAKPSSAPSSENPSPKELGNNDTKNIQSAETQTKENIAFKEGTSLDALPVLEEFKIRTSLDKVREDVKEGRKGHTRVPTKSEEEIGQAAANLLAEIAKSTQVDLLTTIPLFEQPVTLSLHSSPDVLANNTTTSQTPSKEKGKKDRKKKDVKHHPSHLHENNKIQINPDIDFSGLTHPNEAEQKKLSGKQIIKRTHHRTRSYSEGDQNQLISNEGETEEKHGNQTKSTSSLQPKDVNKIGTNQTLSALFKMRWALFYFGIITLLYILILSPFISSTSLEIIGSQSPFLGPITSICTYFILIWIHLKLAMCIFPNNSEVDSCDISRFRRVTRK